MPMTSTRIGPVDYSVRWVQSGGSVCMYERSPYRDPVMAEVYHRITAPYQFAPPARDLVDILHPPSGGVVLDVGTGTGVVAEHIRQVVGSTGCVVGVDGAIEILRFANRSTIRVAARVPGLPFSDGSFDVVTAGFVGSHFADYA